MTATILKPRTPSDVYFEREEDGTINVVVMYEDGTGRRYRNVSFPPEMQTPPINDCDVIEFVTEFSGRVEEV